MEQQPRLELKDHDETDKGPVTCLGMTFANDGERRAHFTELLRQKLQEPEFRQIEGFPMGEDEDILALSDPPYYTACPNPWIADFITEWEGQKPEKSEGYHYHREPFATDVSEGKNDPIYNAHSYHTKVPHKAIMRYILHYTEPGDIVFDGFCGTGMTGVAAQMCGDREVVMSLGYKVNSDGIVEKQEVDEQGRTVWMSFSKLGARRTILNDISPVASFITYNYNLSVDEEAFKQESARILNELEKETSWMYQTKHEQTDEYGKIICVAWSDVFVCPECGQEVNFWESAIDREEGKVRDEFPCPYCSTVLTKRTMERAWVTKFDTSIQSTIKQAKQYPIFIVYEFNNKRHVKNPDEADLKLIDEIEKIDVKEWHPLVQIPNGDKTGEPLRIGYSHVHHFYTKRNLIALSFLLSLINKSHLSRLLKYQFDSLIIRQSKRTRLLVSYFFHGGGGWVGTPLSGNLYIPSFTVEVQPFETWKNRVSKTLARVREFSPCVSACTSSTDTRIPDNSLDYLFFDPPFGANLQYSELNILWESWLKLSTNKQHEAVENKSQLKGAAEYRQLMNFCFQEAYRVLKPGRWITVEFSNTRASVWNGIQTALTDSGFIIANISALDKKQGSFNAVTNATSVKQDLVISAYKPNGGFEKRFQIEAESEEGVWDFVRTHLDYLAPPKVKNSVLQFIFERDPRILFDQVVSFYVRKGYSVPISSPEFQLGLAQRFSERDGMYFLPEQAAEYDRKKMTAQVVQASIFVSDESTAIQWLRQLLKEKPQVQSDIHGPFMQQLGGWKKSEVQLELIDLLNQNFISYDGVGPVPDQIHSYLSSNWHEMRKLDKDNPELQAKAKDRWYVPDPRKAGDLEKLRERTLLRDFETYKESKKKLKVFRFEAMHAGFKKAWQEREYETIVSIAKNLPNKVLEEDPKLLMWYELAVTRLGDG